MAGDTSAAPVAPHAAHGSVATRKRKLPLVPVLLGLLFLLVMAGIGLVLATIQVQGSAELPDGRTVSLQARAWGFSVSSRGDQTVVEAAGHTVIFRTVEIVGDAETHRPLEVEIDGVHAAAIDASVQDLRLEFGPDVRLYSGTAEIATSN